MNADIRKILVLGASGLIGRFVTDDLRARGFPVVGVARKLSASQKSGALDLELPVMSMEAATLARLLRDHRIDVVVNCLGVLQDGPGSDTTAVHCDFVARLLQAIRDSDRAIRLVHISIPGTTETDRTAFSTTKREAERLIAESGVALHDPAAGLRGGACGLWRQRHGALAGGVSARSPGRRAGRAIPAGRHGGHRRDHRLARRARSRRGERRDMGPDAAAAGHARRRDRSIPRGVRHRQMVAHRDAGVPARSRRQSSAISRTCSAGCRRCEPPRSRNCAAASPAIPPAGWPRPASCRRRIEQMAGKRSATIQDKWFARLFLIKALVIASLVLFWVVSGFIALVISYDAAAGILRSHGFPPCAGRPRSPSAPA